jgi:hypothetical protein
MDNINKEWLQNKVYFGQGCYAYKCSNNDCKSTRMMYRPTDPEYNSSIYSKYCSYHYKKMGSINNPIIIC